MLNKKLEAEFSLQVNKELYSAYLYLSMQSYCASTGFMGFANWFKIQACEEVKHAMKIYNYVIERGGYVELGNIESPDNVWTNFTNVFEEAYEHEKSVTNAINHLIEISFEEQDFRAVSFLRWFLDEQTEEESSVEGIVKKLQYGANEKAAILLLDKELSMRTAD